MLARLTIFYPLVRWRPVWADLLDQRHAPPVELIEAVGAEPRLPAGIWRRMLARWWDRNVTIVLASPILAVTAAIAIIRVTGHWRH